MKISNSFIIVFIFEMESKPVKLAKEATKPFVDKLQRTTAFGIIEDKLDPLLVKLAEQADNIYGAKEILSNSDWLACHEEEGQSYEKWLNNPKRNEVNEDKKKIYLNIIDPSIGKEF